MRVKDRRGGGWLELAQSGRVEGCSRAAGRRRLAARRDGRVLYAARCQKSMAAFLPPKMLVSYMPLADLRQIISFGDQPVTAYSKQRHNVAIVQPPPRQNVASTGFKAKTRWPP